VIILVFVVDPSLFFAPLAFFLRKPPACCFLNFLFFCFGFLLPFLIILQLFWINKSFRQVFACSRRFEHGSKRLKLLCNFKIIYPILSHFAGISFLCVLGPPQKELSPDFNFFAVWQSQLKFAYCFFNELFTALVRKSSIFLVFVNYGSFSSCFFASVDLLFRLSSPMSSCRTILRSLIAYQSTAYAFLAKTLFYQD